MSTLPRSKQTAEIFIRNFLAAKKGKENKEGCRYLRAPGYLLPGSREAGQEAISS
jgi:hypothetical protein